VELIVDDGVGSLAIEHTRIEPFPGLFEANAAAGRLFPERYLDLPALDLGSAYELAIEASDLIRAAKCMPALRDALLDWVERVAPTLPAGASQHGNVGEPSVSVTLTRRAGADGSALDGKLLLGLVAPADREKSRKVRISAALASKLPKLDEVRKSVGATMLVLEEFDMWLTNQYLVSAALQSAAEGHRLPEYVTLITTIGPVSLAWLLYEHGRWLDEEFVELRGLPPLS
jgi:hypothetical protein